METPVLEKKLNYRFNNKELAQEACRHSSFVNEQPGSHLRDNERLEFLGDAVLNLAVSHMLMKRFPDHPEGDLSRMRANLVNENQLSELAKEIDLGSHLQLGRGERQTGGNEKKSILADAFEAITAAIYLDGGFDASFAFITGKFSAPVEKIERATSNGDFKSRLQELVQTTHQPVPIYTVVKEEGPDHDKTFVVEISVCGIMTTGEGKSKKAAEQEAAKKALQML